jgi:MHS family proline/betaine transporter-like MFS transporter
MQPSSMGEERKVLTREQKQAVGLLSIGTFLEYFDLMLYVHMAVLLNELFFPKFDPYTASLVSAATFCSTFVFRPLGAYIFGRIGDKIGRKATVIITTTLMAFSCFLMAIVPTYAQIGIAASWVMTICKILQGVASMGEVIGAEIYVSETIKTSARYSATSIIMAASVLGGTVALGIASLVTSSIIYNWRYVFWFGAGIAFIGLIARTTLRETPEFADAKRMLLAAFEKANKNPKMLDDNLIMQEKVNQKTTLAYFLIECAWPVCFYFAYVHCGNILKSSFGLSSEEIIHQNFIVSLIQFIGWLVVIYLSDKIYPLLILKIKLVVFISFLIICPYLLDNISTPFELFLIQSFVLLFATVPVPANPIIFSYFPIFKRFTYSSLIYASSRAVMYIITSFAMAILVNHFGNYGLLIIMIPANVAFAFGLFHFEKLEKESGNYPQKRFFPFEEEQIPAVPVS